MSSRLPKPSVQLSSCFDDVAPTVETIVKSAHTASKYFTIPAPTYPLFLLLHIQSLKLRPCQPSHLWNDFHGSAESGGLHDLPLSLSSARRKTIRREAGDWEQQDMEEDVIANHLSITTVQKSPWKHAMSGHEVNECQWGSWRGRTYAAVHRLICSPRAGLLTCASLTLFYDSHHHQQQQQHQPQHGSGRGCSQGRQPVGVISITMATS